MKPTLTPGAVHEFRYTVPADKTVPHLYPESPDFRAMPEVFATGFMVGLMEWACIDALKPHLDDGEGSLGIGIDVSHIAATLPGQTVTVTVTCDKVEGSRVSWRVSARDDFDLIGEGRHDRAVVTWDRFNSRLAAKRARLSR
jgi:fluoroacetyl-CoA thioesterase